MASSKAASMGLWDSAGERYPMRYILDDCCAGAERGMERTPNKPPRMSRRRIISFVKAHRDRERESRADSNLALHPDPRAVDLHELPTHGKPQPGALDLLGRCPDLAELLEHRLLILRGDAHSGIAD